MKKFVNWLKSPLGIGVETTILGFLLTVSYDFLKNKPVLNTITTILTAIWQFALNILNFELKVWWVLLCIIVLLAIFYVIVKISDFRKPDFIKYIKDSINGWHWEWRWEKNYYGKYSIEDLHPVCPKCDTPLVEKYDHQYDEYNNFHSCLRCNYTTDKRLPDFNHIKVIICDNIKRNLNNGSDTL